MNSALAWHAAAHENLGGGFVAMRRSDGESIVVASSLTAANCVGFVTPLNVDARDEAVLREWLMRWGFPAGVCLLDVNQVHGTSLVAASSIKPSTPPDADGLWTDSPADLIAVRSADCAPVWLAGSAKDAPKRIRLAILHAGWRGTADGILRHGVQAMAPVEAADLYAVVGPCIGPECYEIGPEVAQRFRALEGAVRHADILELPRVRDDSCALDLRAAIRVLLLQCGVRAERIAISNACTRCRADLFHSYRRSGPGGPLSAALGTIVPQKSLLLAR